MISPERWGTMKVSKHHYALELAANNCRVYFIEPPQLSYTGIEIKPCADHSMISIVNYKPVFRGKRFLPSFLYSFLLKQQVKALLKKIDAKPDVVWSFQGYLFQNLQWFGAPVNIFFAADQFYYDELPSEVYSATLSLAVSDTIYERIKQSNRPVYMIGHGLQRGFVKAAEELVNNEIPFSVNKKIVAGYTGNLRMEALDRKTMMQVIEQNPEVYFIFWGSYKKNDLNLGGVNSKEANAFISFLESSTNVELRGVVSSEQLQEQMKEANLFWLCWKIGVKSFWDGSNSHKILEYLSTGRPVVAHHVSSYKNTDLLYMLPVKENTDYANLFQQTVSSVKKGEALTSIQNRLKVAIEGSYKKKLQQIEELLGEVLK
jgi:hypothetical protein